MGPFYADGFPDKELRRGVVSVCKSMVLLVSIAQNHTPDASEFTSHSPNGIFQLAGKGLVVLTLCCLLSSLAEGLQGAILSAGIRIPR